MNYEQEILEAIKESIRQGVIRYIGSQYNGPLQRVIDETVLAKHSQFRELLEGAISGCLADEEFAKVIRAEVRQKLANTLVKRFGKQVSALKSDPNSRAKIVSALEEIVLKTQAAKA